jgi:hypothetical protein
MGECECPLWVKSGLSVQHRSMAALPPKAEVRRARSTPHIAEARAATLKAMKETEAGWQKASDKITERASLTKDPNMRWY